MEIVDLLKHYKIITLQLILWPANFQKRERKVERQDFYTMVWYLFYLFIWFKLIIYRWKNKKESDKGSLVWTYRSAVLIKLIKCINQKVGRLFIVKLGLISFDKSFPFTQLKWVIFTLLKIMACEWIAILYGYSHCLLAKISYDLRTFGIGWKSYVSCHFFTILLKRAKK